MEIHIRAVFQNAQRLPNIPKCIRSLVKLYGENEAAFYDEFYRCVKLALQSDGDIKCLVEFIVKFFVAILKEDEKTNETNDVHNHSGCDDIGFELFGHESFEGRVQVSQSQSLIDDVLKNIIVPYLNSRLVNVRGNACIFVEALFLEIDDVDNKVYNDLKRCLLQRISDKNAYVRSKAAAALHRFQDLKDEKDVVTSAYRFHLKNDPTFEVRLAVLRAMDPTKDTIKDIVSRTRDVKDIIRKSAYLKLAERIHAWSFTIEQRLSILKNGLNDRNPNVRKVVETKLVDSWIKCYNKDIVDLLVALDIQSDTETAEKLVNVIFKRYMDQETCNSSFLHVFVDEFQKQVLDTRKLLTKVPLTVERSFLWKCLVKFCKDNEKALNAKTKKSAGDEEANVVAEIDEMMAGIEVSQPNENAENSERENVSQQSVNDHSYGSTAEIFKNVSTNRRIDEDDLLDSIRPQLPHFCNYLNKFVTKIDKNDFTLEQLMDFEFMYNQLMEILLNYEIGDDAQRNIMEKLTLSMLCAESLGVKFHDYITPIMKCLANNVFPLYPAHLLQFTAEATSKVYNTLAAAEESRNCPNEIHTIDPVNQRDNEMKYAKITVEIQEMRDKLDEAVNNQDYVAAQSLKEQIDNLSKEKERVQEKLMNASCATQSSQTTQTQKTVDVSLSEYPKELFKCLQIFCGCLEYGQFSEVNDIIQTHVDKITIPGILSNEPRIRCIAVKALGLCCLISSEMVTRYFALFVQILKRDVEKVQIMALKSIFDFLCQHGVRVLVSGESERDKNETIPVVDKSKIDLTSPMDIEEIPETPQNTSEEANTEEDVMESLNRLLTDQLRTDSEDLRYVAVQGIAKLLLLGRLYSPSFLSKLILQWYHPYSSSEIKQFLGTFLPIYAFSDARYGPNSNCVLSGQTALEECFMNTIEAIYIAKNSFDDSRRSSSMEADIELADIDLENVIAFLVQLMSEDIHPRVAITVCQKMMDILGLISISKFNKQRELLLKYLPKVLISLNIAEASKPQLKDLRILMRKILSALGKRMNLNTKNMRVVMKRFEKFMDRVNIYLEQVASQDSMISCSQASADNTLNNTVIENSNVVVNTDETTEAMEPIDETIIASAASVFENERSAAEDDYE